MYIYTFLASNFFKILRPRISASYSARLLIHLKYNLYEQREGKYVLPLGGEIQIHDPTPFSLTTSSK